MDRDSRTEEKGGARRTGEVVQVRSYQILVEPAPSRVDERTDDNRHQERHDGGRSCRMEVSGCYEVQARTEGIMAEIQKEAKAA